MNTNSFANRHIGVRNNEIESMLNTIGANSIEQLIYETLPDGIKLEKPLELDAPLSEQEYLEHIHALSEKNKIFKSYIGLGYHPTILPAVIQRNILENPWMVYSLYTIPSRNCSGVD